MNEETVKNDIIMPYFKSLGFDVSDIEYETTFSIKLGKNAYSINGVKERGTGRLDLLFKRNSENLFVVETKSQDHHIDDEDRTQAISYARLLEQIAPFAIVTNGIETEIYDVINNKKLPNDTLKDSSYVVNGNKIALEPELRYRALKNFIGLNVSNLRTFCQKQIAANMQGIVANEHDKEGKFIPAIFLQRQGIKNVFDSFLMSNKKVFSVVAESGFGKTNAICNLAIECSHTNPVLFFNGSQIADDLLEEIEDEFNWDFGTNRSGIDIIQRLAETLIQFDKDLIIFIDAIDEFPNKNSRLHLNNFIKRCPSRIKLCVSCKEAIWPEFLTQSGIRSSLSCAHFVKQEKDNFSFRITSFSPEELDVVIQKYQEFFKLPSIEGSSKALCNNPLMLRALSEVYSAKASIPNNLISATVTKTFLDKKLEKSANPDEDRNFLSILGRFLLQENKELVFEDEIPEHLLIPDFLIDFGVLRLTKDALGRSLIGFQYDNIRDFVMCFFSLKLDRLSEKDLSKIVRTKISGSIYRNVFIYYAKIAENNMKDIIQKEFSKYHFKRAEEFIESYQCILDTEFPVIKELFEPYSKNIGLLVFYSLNYLHAEYGFREKKEEEPKVIWLEKEDWSEPELAQVSLKYGLKVRVMASNDFTVKAPSIFARERIVLQLKHLIDNRTLFEDKNDILMIEYILQETIKSAESWGISNDRSGFAWKDIIPLNLDNVTSRVEKSLRQIDASCRSMGFTDYKLPSDLLKFYYYLEKIRTKQSVIEKYPLPFPSNIRVPVDIFEIDKFTDQEMINYISTFFLLSISEYKELVEFNFPQLKESLKVYQMLPVKVVCEIEKNDNHFDGCSYCFLHSEKNSVEITIKNSESIFDYKNHLVTTSDGKVRVNGWCRKAIWLFFESDSGRRENIIQKSVYDLVFKDFRSILDWDII
jgi:hypothetical protein